MRKSVIVLVVGAFIIMLGALDFSYAAMGKLTRMELAECLCKRQGIKLPAENVAKDVYFNSLATSLARRGITMFQNSKSSDVLTCSQAVDMLYTIAGGEGDVDSAAKIDFLVTKGYLSTAADPTNTASTCEQILCQPPAETYTPAEIIRTEAPDVEKDNPVDLY